MRHAALELMRQCVVCGRGPQMAYHRPHSLHRTKKVVRPNLQIFQGRLFCTRCLRTVTKRGLASAKRQTK